MTFRFTANLISSALLLGACAQKPEAIAASYISPTRYNGMSCHQMQAEAMRLDDALTTASAQQTEARQMDTVGVIFLGLPVSSLSGSNVASQIADLKGQKRTIQRSQNGQSCT